MRGCAATYPLRLLHPKNYKNIGKKQASSLNPITRSLGSSHDLNPIKNPCAKGMSPHAPSKWKVRASMTLEASLALPIFLLFFLTVGSSLEMIRFHSRMEMALWEVGRETCAYGTVLRDTDWLSTSGETSAKVKEKNQGLFEAIESYALSQTFLRGRVEEYLSREYLEEAPVVLDEKGLHSNGGSFVNSDDTVEFAVMYEAKPKWTVAGFRSFHLRNYYLGRMWTGFDVEGEDQGIYYLAENAQVYHRDLTCSHIKLQPELVPCSVLTTAVNGHGSHYRACAICAREAPGNEVWISPEGECYHLKRDCPGLKRTIRTVTWKEAMNYRPCSRCGEKKGEN